MIAAIITIISSILAVLTFIVKFLKDILLKYVTHALILSLQFAITSTSIVFVVAFYAFTITAFLALYNRAIYIINYFITYNGDSAIAPLYGFLNCIGVLPALDVGVSLFFTALGSIMVFHLFRFTYGALNVVKNEIFKLGVLLGQAVD
jgi:hypothetical protein